jgi:hypothetical protein
MIGPKTYTEPNEEDRAQSRAYYNRQLKAAAAVAGLDQVQRELFSPQSWQPSDPAQPADPAQAADPAQPPDPAA